MLHVIVSDSGDLGAEGLEGEALRDEAWEVFVAAELQEV